MKTLFRWNLTLVIGVGIALSAVFMLGAMSISGDRPRTPAVTSQGAQSKMLEVGEELEYKVSYSFFTIGTIRTRVIGKEERNGRTVYTGSAFIDSNPGISWLVSLHIRFYTEMDGSIYSYKFSSEDSSKKETSYRIFRFDYENNKTYLETGKILPSGEHKAEAADTVAITGECEDGLSLFFFAREHVHQKKQENVPTLIEKKQESTFINFMNKRTSSEVDAIEYPVDVIKFEGKADYTGIFGLTGGFSGWFSNDEASVPILARMNVILGSVKIQLVRWNRPGWQPPKYVEGPEE